MAGRSAIASLLLVAVLGSILIEWRYGREMRSAASDHVALAQAQSLRVRREVEGRFREIHGALRTIAGLPGIRAIPPGADLVSHPELRSDPETLAAIQGIFAALARSCGVVSLSIAPFPFDPEGLDAELRFPREPLLTLDAGAPESEFVRPRTLPDLAAASPPRADLAGRSQLMLQQLQWLAKDHAFESWNAAVPPAISGRLRTRSPALQAEPTELLTSVPFYGETSELRGCIAAIIPLTALRDLLPPGDYAIGHPTYGLMIHGPSAGEGVAERDSFAAPVRLHSEVIPLAIADADVNWSLWASTPDDVYRARADVRSAGAWRIASHAAVWLAAVAGIALLGRSRRRFSELAARNHELEAKVRERREEFEKVHRLAHEATEQKSVFLARMSHEIRTPLSAILGYADLLLDAEVDEERRAEALGTIRRNGRHLLTLINDILDLSKLEAGRLEVEKLPVDVRAILKDVVELLRVRAESRQTSLASELRGEIPEQIETDPTRLRQALVNLVGNAIKFTEGGEVRIAVECDRDAGKIAFHVIDNGIGMTTGQVARIFQPFSQADPSTSRRFGGTGLGLTITRSIAELLGGEVRVASEPGKGSTFTLAIATGPLEGIATLAGVGGTAEPAPRAPSLPHIDGRVLLVEDGLDSQAIISYMLRRAGAEVMLASNGQEGAELALGASRAGRPFDVILMDMQMPVLDGYQATQWLREEGYDGQVIALTAHALSGDLDKCLAAGCDSYLAKPVEREVLVREIAQRVGMRSGAKAIPQTVRA